MTKMKINKIILTIFFLISICFINGALSDNNEAYYTFDNTLNDATGNGYTISNTGLATYTSSGKINGAYSFDGSNNYMTSEVVNPLDGSYTIATWIYGTSFGSNTNRDVVSRGNFGDNPTLVFGVFDNKLFFQAEGTGDQYNAYGTKFVQVNTWYHIAVTFDAIAKTITLYIDGDNGEVFDYSGTNIGSINPTGSMTIGSHATLGSGWFEGTIDEISFWSEAKTQEEIFYLYAGSNPSILQQYPYAIISCDTLEERLANGCLNFDNNIIGDSELSGQTTRIVELNNDKIAILYKTQNSTNKNVYFKTCDLNATNCDSAKLIKTSTGIIQDIDIFEDITNNNIIITIGLFNSVISYITDLDGNIIAQYDFDSDGASSISSVQTTTTDFVVGYDADTQIRLISCKLDGSSCSSPIDVSYGGLSSYNNHLKLIKNSNNDLTFCYITTGSLTVCRDVSLDLSTFGSTNQINSNTSYWIDMIEGSDNKLKIVYEDIGNSNYGTFLSCDLDGSNCGSKITFQESTSTYNSINEFNGTLFISSYNNSLYNMNLAGSSISEPSLFSNTTTNYMDSIITSRNKVLISYADPQNLDIVVAVSEQLGLPTPNNRSIEQTYIDLQINPITLTGTGYTTILSGSFNLTQDDVINYGSSTLQITSDTNNEVACRTNLDNINSTEITRTNYIDTITSMNIFRGDTTLSTGQHNITVECREIGTGNITINRGVGVGHLLTSKNGEEVQNVYDSINNTITSGTFYNVIGNSTIVSEETKIGFEKYLIVDWGTQITNQDTSTDTMDIQVKIFNTDDNVTPIKICKEFKYTIESDEIVNIGSSCYIEIDPIETYVIKYYGTGTNIDYEINSHIKILDLLSTEVGDSSLTSETITSTNFTEIATISLVNVLSDVSLYVKASANIKTNTGTDTIAHFKLKIEGDSTYESQDIEHTAQIISSDFISEGSIPIPTGNINVKILAYCENNNCIIDSGELLAYITETNQLQQKEFIVFAANKWNDSIINSFNVYTDNNFYETITGNITIPTSSDYIDFTVSDGSSYIPLDVLNHNTLINYSALLYQSILELSAKSIYDEPSLPIQSFDVNTIQGTFSTSIGKITLYPNLGDYLFNFTFSTYYDVDDVSINITLPSESRTLTGVYDNILYFENSSSDTIYPSCNWLENTIEPIDENSTIDYLITSQESSSIINCTLLGYLPFVYNVSYFSSIYPQSNTIQMNTSKIVINLYDRSTGNVLTTLTTVTLEDYGSKDTSNGTVEFINDNFIPGSYTVTAVAAGYYTEQKTFTYNNEEIATVSLNLLATTQNDTASLYVSVLDEFTNILPNANVKLEAYNNDIEGFEEVTQSITNSNGECQFLVEIGTKKYRIYASKIINGILQEQYSTPIGEYFQPDIFEGETVYKELVRQIILSVSEKLESPDFMDLEMEYPTNESSSILFQNDSTYITYIPIEFTSTNNLDYNICLEYYVKTNNALIPSLSPICLESSSGQVPTYNFTLSRDYTNVAKITVSQNNKKITQKTYIYPGNDSLWYLLNKNNYVSSFILIVWISLLAFSLYSKKIGIFCYGAMVIAILQSSIFPSVMNISGSIMIILISVGILYLVRKQQDNV